MSRSGNDGAPKIPNMQALVVPANIRPAWADGKMEVGGVPVDQAPQVDAGERLQPSYMKGTSVTGFNAGIGEVKHYRVVRAGDYKPKNDVNKHKLYEGKVLDDSNYDIREVRAQGVRLEECDADGNARVK